MVRPLPAVDLSAITAASRCDRTGEPQRSGRRSSKRRRKAKADDAPLRRVVVASLLDLSVRQGEPSRRHSRAAKTLAPDAAALKPLEGFAATGVPTAAA